ncbi:hypothetical protein P4H71_20490 [Paenibacillus kribbensis]|uniref:hypothetical protein n=1 Tax=Paenibacillus TaxID=44249 RepID=UPI00024F070B|nr:MULTISPECIES: hypothetical protein [Paenibacillus]EHS54967.1 hypothetical protein WG8_4999 [Paenibacillus sp. Aloe-11]MEC0236701.1 hypothetical protein [Paenibacillus kribbensis]
MNKNKLFLASALSISLLGAVAVPSGIFASSDVNKSRDVFNDTFDRKDPVSRFELVPGYGHLKIFVKNRGNSTITFSLVHKDSGKLYITKTVGAGKELSWNSLDSFSQGLRSGNYEMQWRAGGNIVNVTAWGVSGTDSANTSTMVTQNAGTTTTDDRVITPQKMGNSFNFTIGGSATASGSFEVPKGFGYVKLRIRNYANAPVDFTVEHNDSGKVYVDGQTVRKNSETVWRSNDVGISDGMRSGRYTIQFRGGSNKVNVEIWGVASSLPSYTK